MLESIWTALRRSGQRLGVGANEVGAVGTEYGLILTFIAVVIIAAVIAFGIVLNGLFEQAPAAFPAD